MRRLVTAVAAVVTAIATLAGPVAPAGAGVGHAGHSSQAGQGAPRPDEPGPRPVGLTTVQMADPARGGRTLAVDIWYPAVRRSDADTARLDLLLTDLELPGVLAAPAAARGSFPLVVFSHGNGGVRFQSWFLMQALASHGFVVASPDHTGNTAVDAIFGTSDPLDVAAANRPRDVSFVIDQMVAADRDPASPLHGRINEGKVAVAGHSFGGFTALATATGWGDYPRDGRVDAVVPLAAATFLHTDEQLASLDVPTLLMSGTADRTVPLDPAITRAWDLIGARPAYRVDIQAAGHSSFTNVCDIRDAYVAAGVGEPILGLVQRNAAEACAPELLPIDQAHRVVELYVVSFLTNVLRRDARFDRFLTASAVDRFDLPVELFARRGRGRAAA